MIKTNINSSQAKPHCKILPLARVCFVDGLTSLSHTICPYQAALFYPSTDLLLGSPIQVSATDVDTGMGGQIRYSCRSGCQTFQVRGDSGAVVLKSQVDAETQPQHVLTVVATDAGMPQLSSTATVIVDGERIVKFTYLSSCSLTIFICLLCFRALAVCLCTLKVKDSSLFIFRCNIIVSRRGSETMTVTAPSLTKREVWTWAHIFQLLTSLPGSAVVPEYDEDGGAVNPEYVLLYEASEYLLIL